MMKTIPMRLTLLSLLIAVSGVMFYSCKGKVKDSDLQLVIADKAKTITGLGTATASVKDGVVTLTGKLLMKQPK
ncbi:hypothetical protein [Paraflavitalea speifideaquila]|uniref:hypothetical protein n=1 Tax=Paraflavitalea speifideaquila TaxID=3076558 RepID=UPI0028E69DBA|nr:hypothetical protein [Paraflavitalea speifideiaquila]